VKAGDTFFLAGGAADRHLRVVISDPSTDSGRVLFVSMTSYDVTKESVCVFELGDHPFVKHKSCIAYGSAKEAPLSSLLRLLEAGQLRLSEPVSVSDLERIRRGLSLSRDIKQKYLDLMLDQGLLD
jgi:hypothetical protein